MSDIAKRLCCYCGHPIGGDDMCTVHGFTFHASCCHNAMTSSVETTARLAGIALALVAGARVTFHHARGDVWARRNFGSVGYGIVGPQYACSAVTPWQAARDMDTMLEALAQPREKATDA